MEPADDLARVHERDECFCYGADQIVAGFVSEAWDPAPTVECAPTSGEQFLIGTMTVICTATDDSGNTATESFDVHVEDASEQDAELAESIHDAALDHGVETALVAKLAHPECAHLLAFETLVANGERGGHIPPADGDAWIADARRISRVNGCQ